MEKRRLERVKAEKKKYRLEDIFGIDKSKTKGDSRKDVDQVVYGI